MKEDTFPKLLLRNYQKWGDKKVAMRKKEFGVWREYTWKDYYESVKYFSLGLRSLGLERGEKLAIMGDNDPQWFWAELAAQAAGGIITSITSSCSPPEVKYIAEHSDSRFVVVQDQEQVDKLLQIKDELPLVKKVIYWNHKGLRHYDDPMLTSFKEVSQLGHEQEERFPGLFEQGVEKGRADDLALILYTSGTTGLPKGVMISHHFYMTSSSMLYTLNPYYETDEFVSFTLPGWAIEQCLGLIAGLMIGQTMNFPEKQDTVQENIREIAPQNLLYPSRLWESLYSDIQVKISESNWLFRLLYKLCLPVGYKVTYLKFKREKPNLFWRVLHNVAELAMFRPLRDKHGLTRIRVPYTGGAVLGPDVLRFFSAIGLNLRQIYGTTEAAATAHMGNDIKFDTVGIPEPGICLRISDEGEIWIDKKNSFSGYYKDPEATEKKFSGNWFRTGDAGYFNEDGHLIFIDRLDDMKQLADGTKFSPQYIESRLKFSPYIRDAFVVGGEDRNFVGAVLNIDFSNVGNWAEKKKIPFTTFVDLSQKKETCDLVRKEVEKINKLLPEKARLKRFVNLHKEFDPDEAELTRTMKLRRSFVEERYRELLEALYGEREELVVEAPVVYRDGRKGIISTNIRVTHCE